MLELKDICVSFRTERKDKVFGHGKKQVLFDVSLKVRRGSCLGILGESGSGKSTMGRVLCGLLKPDSGQYELEGNPVYASRAGRRRLQDKLSVVFQDYTTSADPRFRVRDIIAEGLMVRERRERRRVDRKKEVAELLEVVGLPAAFSDRFPHELSGGQLQRVCIARAVACRPEVILFDEAISSLDAHTQVQVMDLLMDLRKKYDMTYIFITHDLTAITYICDDVLFLYQGRVTEYLPVTRIGETKDAYARKLLSSIVRFDTDKASEKEQYKKEEAGEAGLIVAGETILPGEKKTVRIPVKEGEAIEAVCFHGARPGKKLVVTAGVHGTEYVGIEALKRLSKTLSAKALSGSVILVPLLNRSGFHAGAKQYVPEDGENLNRAFPGTQDGTITSRIAHAVEQHLYPHADLLADLHGGEWNEELLPLVFFPTAGAAETNLISEAAAKALSVPYRVRSTAKNGLYSYAVQKGIPALLIERGFGGRWSEEEVEACILNVIQMMRYLGICPEEQVRESSEMRETPLKETACMNASEQIEITQAVYEEADREGYWYPSVRAGAAVRKGQLLGKLEDRQGGLCREIRAKFEGIVLYYVEALGVSVGDPLVTYGRSE